MDIFQIDIAGFARSVCLVFSRRRRIIYAAARCDAHNFRKFAVIARDGARDMLFARVSDCETLDDGGG